LAVFFDATATTSSLTTRPFHEIEYRWDFGDPAGGATWSAGSRAGVSSKNLAMGPMAAHVFETPGTYFVTLTAFDGTNTDTTTVPITVENPNDVFSGSNTICLGSSFVGCPDGAQPVSNVTDFANALTTYAAPGRRLLFRGGETFTVGSPQARLRVNGPGIIGSYGTGKARIVSTANATILSLSSLTTPNLSDWRIMDLNIDGQTRLENFSTAIVSDGGGFDQLTLLRLDIHDIGSGITFGAAFIQDANVQAGGGLNNPHHLWDQLAIVDNTIRRIGGGNRGNPGLGSFLAARRMSYMGNVVDDTTQGEHPVRVQHASRFVFSNNSLSGAPDSSGPRGNKETLTIRALNSAPGGETNYPFVFPGGVAVTENVLVSDNELVINGYVGAALNDVTTITDQRIREVIFERNWYRATAATSNALDIRAVGVTVRNEIIDTTGFTPGHLGIRLMEAIITPGWGCPSDVCMVAASDVRVLNNSFYSADPGNFNAVRLESGVSNITIQNNLGYAPSADPLPLSVTMISNPRGLPVTACAACNSSATQIRTTSPGWAITAPRAPSGFRPAGSYAVGGGIPTTAFSDFNLNLRAAPYDMGAVNH